MLFLGWFGPRGIASILYVLLLVEESSIAGGDLILSVVMTTVLLSVFAHGLTAVPAANWYAAFTKRAHKQAAEHVHVQEMPVRIPSRSSLR